jgi:tetratricopeptide (TPR) repeat protein
MLQMSNLLENPEFQQAVALHKDGQLAEAIACYQKLLETESTNPDLWNLKGLALYHQGNAAEAARAIALATVLKPAVADYWLSLGEVRQALPDQQVQAADAFNHAGNALQEQCLFAPSLSAYDRGLALDPANPSIIVNRAACLDRQGRYEEAVAGWGTALQLLNEPKSLEDWLNIANSHSGLGGTAAALAAFEWIIGVWPELAVAHCSRAMLLLRHGRLIEGWTEYEWRWQKESRYREPRGLFRQPVWQGESPAELDGALLVVAEQGFGDIIQFVRYVLLLADAGHQVIFESLPELTSLFQQGFSHPNITVVSRIDEPFSIAGGLNFAAWVGVMSLPQRFATTLETIPAPIPYLAITAEKTARWQARLAEEPRPKIGLVYAGNPKNMNDHARSLPPALLGLLLARDDVAFYSLQKGAVPLPGVNDLGPFLTDFTETGAVLQNLDLLITVDTSAAHLAGALGKPVWLLTALPPDWRWLEQGDFTAWYPNFRIFRQQRRGDWAPVVDEVSSALDTSEIRGQRSDVS